jgi:tetratricopeptide (TPR) repeat protein
MLLEGIVHHARGDHDKATKHIESALATGRINPLANYALANVAASAGDFTTARKLLPHTANGLPGLQLKNLDMKNHLDKGYRSAAAHLNLAAVYVMQSWGRPAHDEARAAISADGDNPLAHYLAGKALRLTKGYDKAIDAFAKAHEIEPRFVSALTEMGKLYADRGNYAKAAECYTDLFKIRGIDQLVDPVPLRLALASFYLKEGRGDKALKLYQAIEEHDPRNAVALNEIGWIYGTSKENPERAVPYLERAVALAPNNPRYVDNLGWMLYVKGDYKEAKTQLHKARELLPSSPTIAYHLAMTYAKLGDTDTARTHVERALALSDDFDQRDEALRLSKRLEEN